MSVTPEHRVYEMIHKFFEFRGATPVEPMNVPNFQKEISLNKSKIIVAKATYETPRGSNYVNTAIVILGQGSEAANKTPKFADITNRAYKAAADFANPPRPAKQGPRSQMLGEKTLEIIIIMQHDEPSPSIKSVMKELANSYNESNPGIKVILSVYPYRMFISNKTTHVSADKHTFAVAEEIKYFEEKLFLDSRNFPRIFNSDPQIVWLGAQIGDVVRVERKSETAGQSIVYKLVVETSKILEEIRDEDEI